MSYKLITFLIIYNKGLGVNMNKVIILSIFFAIIGTLIGSFLGIFFAKRTQKSIGILLGFTAGIMIGIVSIDVVPTLLIEYDILKVILYLLLGSVLTHLIDKYLENYIKTKKIKDLNNQLVYTGFLMLIALALHNIPEGIALSASSLYNINMGLKMGIVIAIHDIPEGMAISGPMISGGIKKKKAFFYAVLTSLFTIFGSLIGISLGSYLDELIYVALALASGAMLYVAYKDLIPRSLEFIEESLLTMMILIGFICSLVIICL